LKFAVETMMMYSIDTKHMFDVSKIPGTQEVAAKIRLLRIVGIENIV